MAGVEKNLLKPSAWNHQTASLRACFHFLDIAKLQFPAFARPCTNKATSAFAALMLDSGPLLEVYNVPRDPTWPE